MSTLIPRSLLRYQDGTRTRLCVMAHNQRPRLPISTQLDALLSARTIPSNYENDREDCASDCRRSGRRCSELSEPQQWTSLANAKLPFTRPLPRVFDGLLDKYSRLNATNAQSTSGHVLHTGAVRRRIAIQLYRSIFFMALHPNDSTFYDSNGVTFAQKALGLIVGLRHVCAPNTASSMA